MEKFHNHLQFTAEYFRRKLFQIIH